MDEQEALSLESPIELDSMVVGEKRTTELGSKVVGEKRSIDELDDGVADKRYTVPETEPAVQSQEISTQESVAAVENEEFGAPLDYIEPLEKTRKTELPLASQNCNKKPIEASPNPIKQEASCLNFKPRRIDLNLNSDALSSACSLKKHNISKSREDDFEGQSSTGLLEEKDALMIWKEMKQNGFISNPKFPSHGGIPVPKKRGRKSKTEILKKNMELAKQENIDRFAKIAAPSGLLNGFNPGIINHVRNRKQVQTIMENLVRSENLENSTSKGRTENINQPILSQDGYLKSMNRYFTSISEDKSVEDNGTVALKFASSTEGYENAGLSTNEESENSIGVPPLTLKAATVASQWLELLQQDIKGRLLALRRSKKRVHAVISTELPFLLHKEFSLDQENDPNRLANNVNVDLHRTRWSMMFNEMSKTLCEEEKQLESWLNQVKEKQMLCDEGLQHINWSRDYGLLQKMGYSSPDGRLGKAIFAEKELAVKAAAASIYSTCNFMMPKENVS